MPTRIGARAAPCQQNEEQKHQKRMDQQECGSSKAGEHGGAPQEQIARESGGAGEQEKAGAYPKEKGGDAE
jgi:hypothetical protein